MKIKSSIRSRLPEIPKPQTQGHKDFCEAMPTETFTRVCLDMYER